MLPKTTAQNIVYAVLIILGAMLLGGVTSLVQQLPGDAPILWRPILLDTLKAGIESSAAFTGGWLLPRPTKEMVAHLSGLLGTKKTEEILQTAVEATPTSSVDIHDLAIAVLDESERRKRAATQPFREATTSSNTVSRT